jgi:very-short-patch-repair endonuclease
MKKTLTVRPPEDRTDPPQLQRKGRGWVISESRLDTLHENAREMRRNPTDAHTALAEALVRAELGKYRFRRQIVIGSAIVDFACDPLRVVGQIDDAVEGDPAIDRRRDTSLEEVGMKVVRVPAAAVLADADAVAATVVAQMKVRWQEQQRTKPRSSPGGRPQTARRGY